MGPKLSKQRAEFHANVVTSKIIALPVNPFAIAADHNILVESRESNKPGVSGFLIKVGDNFGIAYSSQIPSEGFKNFTVAHELGHYFLPGHPEHLFSNGNGIHESRSGFVSQDPHEREADFFAAALLMPEGLFKKAAQSAGGGFAAISVLAYKCKTSFTATAIRYTQFVEHPVAVILSSGDRVEFCFLSQLMQEVRGVSALQKGDLLPQSTPTAKFNNNGLNCGGCNTDSAVCFLNQWFDDAPEFEMNEDVVGLGSYGKTLTVLFTTEEIEVGDESE
jgi:hypothetical protein